MSLLKKNYILILTTITLVFLSWRWLQLVFPIVDIPFWDEPWQVISAVQDTPSAISMGYSWWYRLLSQFSGNDFFSLLQINFFAIGLLWPFSLAIFLKSHRVPLLLVGLIFLVILVDPSYLGAQRRLHYLVYAIYLLFLASLNIINSNFKKDVAVFFSGLVLSLFHIEFLIISLVVTLKFLYKKIEFRNRYVWMCTIGVSICLMFISIKSILLLSPNMLFDNVVKNINLNLGIPITNTQFRNLDLLASLSLYLKLSLNSTLYYLKVILSSLKFTLTIFPIMGLAFVVMLVFIRLRNPLSLKCSLNESLLHDIFWYILPLLPAYLLIVPHRDYHLIFTIIFYSGLGMFIKLEGNRVIKILSSALLLCSLLFGLNKNLILLKLHYAMAGIEAEARNFHFRSNALMLARFLHGAKLEIYSTNPSVEFWFLKNDNIHVTSSCVDNNSQFDMYLYNKNEIGGTDRIFSQCPQKPKNGYVKTIGALQSEVYYRADLVQELEQKTKQKLDL